MHVYTIMVPLNKNDGTPYYHDGFEHAVFNLAGGFTKHFVAMGCWRDDTGKVYRDKVFPYELALAHADDLATILAAFVDAFPDQQAIYVRSGDRATIYDTATIKGMQINV